MSRIVHDELHSAYALVNIARKRSTSRALPTERGMLASVRVVAPGQRDGASRRSSLLGSSLVAVAVALAGLGTGCVGSGGDRNGSPSSVIVLNKAIGGVRLGERRASVASVLGESGRAVIQSKPSGPPDVRVSYPSAHLTAVFAGNGSGGKVIGLLTNSRRFHTSEGIRVGSPVSKVRALPGAQCSASGSQCQLGFTSAPGTIFVLQGGHVTSVEISLRATG
jgi:hypothetical protein